MSDKSFKTIDEQIDILRSRGLIILNEEEARQFLLRNGYYRISGYTLTLRKNDIFYKGTTFQNIIDIYSFDHELRHLLLKYIEIIEITVKSIYAHKFTEAYGAIGYLDENNFTSATQYKAIFEKSEKQKQIRLPHEAYLKHFVNDLRIAIPFWAYIDLFTISDISFLYSISEQTIKKKVAVEFGLTMNRNDILLGQFMKSMTILRNLCAHGSRLYNRLFEQKPSLNRAEQSLLRRTADGSIDNAHLYGFLFIMRRLLPNSNFHDLKDGIIELTQKYPFVKMKHYGFRSDWTKLL